MRRTPHELHQAWLTLRGKKSARKISHNAFTLLVAQITFRAFHDAALYTSAHVCRVGALPVDVVITININVSGAEDKPYIACRSHIQSRRTHIHRVRRSGFNTFSLLQRTISMYRHEIRAWNIPHSLYNVYVLFALFDSFSDGKCDRHTWKKRNNTDAIQKRNGIFVDAYINAMHEIVAHNVSADYCDCVLCFS